MNDSLRIRPGTVSGTVTAPPSKSVTHRAYLLAALSDRPATVAHPLDSADTRATLACLHALGSRMTMQGGAVRFEPAVLRAPARALDCANSGTTLRLMAATAARLASPVTLTGDDSLRRRPNGPLLEALHAFGARVRSRAGLAPIAVQGPMHPGAVALPANSSSQFASALLLSLPMLKGASEVSLLAPIASRPYLDLTLRLARAAGLRYTEKDSPPALRIEVPGGQVPRLDGFAVEGDWSGAAFMLAAAAVSGGEVAVRGLDAGSAQGDRAMMDHLASFGCTCGVASGDATVRGPAHLESPGTIDVAATPDLFPVLAVVAACARGTTTFTGGAQLRAKESDRIRAMAEGLARMGIRCEEKTDGLVVHGGRLQGASLASKGDHRIHMAFAVAGLAAEGETLVDGAPSAAVSYPGFHDDLKSLGARTALAQEVRP